MFAIANNADGTATIFDDGLPVATFMRDEHSHAYASEYGSGQLNYVAQGVTVNDDNRGMRNGVHIGCASRSAEVRTDPARYRQAFDVARERCQAEQIAGITRAFHAGDDGYGRADLESIVRNIAGDEFNKPVADALTALLAENP
jgi:hypothetical protein